MSTLTVTKHL